MTDTQTPDAGDDGIVVTTAADLMVEEPSEPEEAEFTTPNDVAEAEAEESESSTDEEEAEHAERKVPKGLQKRFGEFTRRIKETEATNAALQAQLEKALGALNQLAKPDEPQKPKREGAPEYSDYIEDGIFDGAAYQAALVEYEVEKRFREREQRELADRQAQTIRQREAEFAREHPDYGDVLSAVADDPVFRSVAAQIADADDAPAIAYQLATHPEELRAIARMSPTQALMHIGRLTAKTQAPAPVERKAPEPIKPVQNAKADHGGYLGRTDISQREWEARREKELRR